MLEINIRFTGDEINQYDIYIGGVTIAVLNSDLFEKEIDLNSVRKIAKILVDTQTKSK